MAASQQMNFGIATRPKAGESVNGDALFIAETDGKAFLAVIDGMGHGEDAHYAATRATAFFEDNSHHDLETIIKGCHQELRGSRGAAIGIAMVNIETDTLSYAGIGNIEARVMRSEISHTANSPTMHDHEQTVTSTKGSYQMNGVLHNIRNTEKALHLISMNGIVGYNLKKVKVFQYPYRPGDTVVMFSDGISSRIDLFEFLPKEDLQAAAQTILEKHGKNDDATILLAQRPVDNG